MSTLIAEPLAAEPTAELPAWKRISAFGTGFGIVVGVNDLYAAVVRARPAGPALVAETVIAAFRSRPAAEWGAELSRFISSAGENSLAATVLLPRREVIVRTLNFPGVADKDAANAIELQIDTLHPYGDEEVAWGWSRAGADSVIVGIARRILLESYETLFSEAGIPLAAVTFSPTVIYSALRIWSAGPVSVLCPIPGEPGQPENRTEIYGESPSRAIFSAEFSMPCERAVAVTRAELRLPPELAAGTLAAVLPQSRALAPAVMTAYAAAIAGSVPRIAKFGNLLPAERRASHDRVQYLLPGVLGLLLAALLLVFFVVLPAVGERRYRNELNQAAQSLEPAAARARALEKSTNAARTKITTLDDFRARPRLDLDSLNELTRLLPPPVWTNSIEIYPDSIFITGEAENAAPLLKILDSSPLFQNSEFVSSVVRTQQGEQFRIKMIRRGRTGRSTP